MRIATTFQARSAKVKLKIYRDRWFRHSLAGLIFFCHWCCSSFLLLRFIFSHISDEWSRQISTISRYNIQSKLQTLDYTILYSLPPAPMHSCRFFFLHKATWPHYIVLLSTVSTQFSFLANYYKFHTKCRIKGLRHNNERWNGNRFTFNIFILLFSARKIWSDLKMNRKFLFVHWFVSCAKEPTELQSL